MAYNLPDAWDPGFVLPKNVLDEGLERRAFVSKWLPRGSYDDPSVGTAGYVIPQYVLDEDYGQGTFTTKWQPGGTYNGPRIPHWLNQRPQVVASRPLPGGGRQVTVQAMSGDEPMPAPFEQYGQRAAAGLIAQVAQLPATKRAAAMKSILDAVDKSLWTRTQEIFQRYVKQGTPPANAFPLALARALSTGITAEILMTGLRRTAPQAKSLLGLGCYGCAAILGATGGLGDDATEPLCDPPAGFTWVAAKDGIPGHWERMRRGQTTPVKGPCAPTGAPVTAETREHRDQYDFFIGPFGFRSADIGDRAWTPTGEDGVNRSDPPDILYLSPDLNYELPTLPTGSPVRPLTADVINWLRDRLREEKDANGKTDTPVHYVDKSAMYGYPETDAPQWFTAMGIGPSTPVRMHNLAALRTTILPFARTKDPNRDPNAVGSDMLMHISLAKMNYSQPWDVKTNPLVLKVWLTRVPDTSVWAHLWDPMILINPIAGLRATATLASEGAKYLGNLSCDILKDPQGKAAAQAGASAVAAYYGLPPQAGAEGVNIAADACGQPPPPPPPPMAVHHSIWPYVLLAGGALTAVVLLAKPKKKAHHP